MISGQWFYENHGKVFHPLEVLAILSKDYKYPAQAYVRLEEKGHLIPMSYHRGEIDSIFLFFPKKRRLVDIEEENGLDRGVLIKKLWAVSIEGGVRAGSLRLPDRVVEELKDERYLIGNNGFAKLGTAGYKLLLSRY